MEHKCPAVAIPSRKTFHEVIKAKGGLRPPPYCCDLYGYSLHENYGGLKVSPSPKKPEPVAFRFIPRRANLRATVIKLNIIAEEPTVEEWLEKHF